MIGMSSYNQALCLTLFRGSQVVSRLANLHPDRFIAYGFVTIGYMPLSQESFDAAAVAAQFKSIAGRDVIGYWEFFLAEDAASVIESHVYTL